MSNTPNPWGELNPMGGGPNSIDPQLLQALSTMGPMGMPGAGTMGMPPMSPSPMPPGAPPDPSQVLPPPGNIPPGMPPTPQVAIPRPQAAAGPPISLPPSTVQPPAQQPFHMQQPQSFPTKGAARMSNIATGIEAFRQAQQNGDAQKQALLIATGKQVRDKLEAIANGNMTAQEKIVAQQGVLDVPGNKEALEAAYPGTFPKAKDTRSGLQKVLGGIGSAVTGVPQRPAIDTSGTPNLPTQTTAQQAAALQGQIDLTKNKALMDSLPDQVKAALAQAKNAADQQKIVGDFLATADPDTKEEIARKVLGIPEKASKTPVYAPEPVTIDGKPAMASYDKTTGKWYQATAGGLVDVSSKVGPKADKEAKPDSLDQQYIDAEEKRLGRKLTPQETQAAILKLKTAGPQVMAGTRVVVVDRDGKPTYVPANQASGETATTPGVELHKEEYGQLTPAGQKTVSEIDPTIQQIDQILSKLEPLKDKNTPGYFTLARAGYGIGIAPNHDDITGQIANLELAKITGAMPYATKSRNFQYIQQIQQHLPNTWVDSPQLMYDKLQTAKTNLQRIKDDVGKYEVKGATAEGGTDKKDPLGIR